MTIGEIIQKMTTNIFPTSPTNDLERKCLDREQGIKQYMEICNTMIFQHIDISEEEKKKLSYWKKEKIKSNIQNLIAYLTELALECEKNKIEEYCENLRFGIAPFNPDILFLIHNSYFGSIVTDIIWAEDITIIEAMDISGGKKDLNDLGKKLPDKLNQVKNKILPFLKSSKKYVSHTSSLQEAIICYEMKCYKACNLLLMTSIEGIVRNLAEFLNIKQQLSINLEEPKFNSLDSLLRNGGWKNDYRIDTTKLSLIIGVQKTNIEKLKNLKAELIEETEINLKTRLDFLRRRFKDDRDLILHGIGQEYGSDWNLFLNFSALLEVYKVIKYYDEFYE